MQTDCCIVGGGPAGMVLGLLLARAGVQTTVFEQHSDFFRDFRGDTIHPSTLEIMYELGILDEFLKRPHQVATQLRGYIENQEITIADFSRLKVKCPYIAFMPQWDFLSFVAEQAKKYPGFKLQMNAEVTDLLIEDGKVVGVKAKTTDGELITRCTLVVGADGRHSTVRARANMQVTDIGAPMDVFWFRLSRKPTDPNETFGKFSAGKIMILIDRQDYWQCGYVIAKGFAEDFQKQDIKSFREKIASVAEFLSDRVDELQNWDAVKLLSVKVDRLQRWYMPGLLCIGDAAHAMSPVGGVGINLAIQDAVAAANIIALPLKNNQLELKHLQQVQQRRVFPMKVIQALQVFIQNRVIKNVLHQQNTLQIPWLLRKVQTMPFIRRKIGHLIGLGVRPEHINIL